MPRPLRSLPLALALVFAFSPPAPEGSGPGRSGFEPKGSPPGGLTPSFVENRGQADPRVAFSTLASRTSVFFTDEGLRLGLEDLAGTAQRWNLALGFLGAGPTAPRGVDRAGVASYFRGPAAEWKAGVPAYERVVYRDLWPGIDLAYAGRADGLKYSFVVRPGADPSEIRLGWRGATRVALRDDGALEVATPAGTILDEAPTSHQIVEGRRTGVPTSFELDGSTYGFRVGAFDPGVPLVIDPALLYSGFIGGAASDGAFDVAVDATGSAYVAGQTSSDELTFPESVGPDLIANGMGDAFVAKVDPSGASLVYAGFIGGSAADEAWGIAVDDAGAAYVAGTTSSSEATFPVSGGPDLGQNGMADAFVAKVNPSGTGLVYAGYVGGSGSDLGFDVAVDGAGSAYVTGVTESTAATFPAAVGPDTSHNGGFDQFVAKVSPSGSGLVYAGYVGGSGEEYTEALPEIAVDQEGAAYLAGSTDSTEATFPETIGPDLSYNGGPLDAFVAKVDPAGSELEYAGYVGGSAVETGSGVAVDLAGRAYLTGITTSTEASFPVSVGPDLSSNGDFDAYVARVNPSGTALEYAGYIGGSDFEYGLGLDADAAGGAYVTGWTESTEVTFPVSGGPDLAANGMEDAFVAKVDPSGAGLVYASFIGGSADDRGWGVAADAGGNAYVAGEAFSTEATFPVLGGPDLTHNGGGADAFVAKVETTDRCQGRAVTLLGSDMSDSLVGTGASDTVLALGGKDTVRARGGKDRVCAGRGNDTVKGGAGPDRLDGEGGRDQLVGGGGRDRCRGGPGKDTGKSCERGRV